MKKNRIGKNERERTAEKIRTREVEREERIETINDKERRRKTNKID